MATTTAVGAWLFLHESLTKLKVAALVLAFVGMLVVNVSQYGQGGSGSCSSSARSAARRSTRSWASRPGSS
jgi:drug/metabolite transporter (DMT)-like permease